MISVEWENADEHHCDGCKKFINDGHVAKVGFDEDDPKAFFQLCSNCIAELKRKLS